MYVHKHRSPLSSDQFFFHDLFLQSRDEKFKSPTVNINYEGNLQNSQVLPPNKYKIKFLSPQNSPTTTYYCTLVSRLCLYLSLSLFTIQTRRADHSDDHLLMDTSGDCWRDRRECCSFAAGIWLESWSTRQGKYGVRSGDAAAPRPGPILF